MSYLSDSIEEEDDLKESIEKRTRGKKILFMGVSQSGKTSILKTVLREDLLKEPKIFQLQ